MIIFFSSRRRHTRYWRDWSSDVCSSDLEALDLKQLADNANMSSFHFHRIFTRLKGETPHHFIRRCRVEKAVQLIQSGQTLFLNEIAYECGFTTQSLFVKTFRKHYGISPHEFRKQLK